MDIQLIAGVGFRTVECDALDSVRRLHGKRCLFSVGCVEVIWHRHCIFYAEIQIENCLEKYIQWQQVTIFGYEVRGLYYNIDHDDDDQKGDATRPFQPGAASTPYHGGEQYEMQTMQHEQSGLPDTSYDEETSLLRKAGSITDLQRESSLRQKMKKICRHDKSQIPKSKL